MHQQHAVLVQPDLSGLCTKMHAGAQILAAGTARTPDTAELGHGLTLTLSPPRSVLARPDRERCLAGCQTINAAPAGGAIPALARIIKSQIRQREILSNDQESIVAARREHGRHSHLYVIFAAGALTAEWPFHERSDRSGAFRRPAIIAPRHRRMARSLRYLPLHRASWPGPINPKSKKI
jgi:hypothetical protein